jgi:hypothetical protein
LHGDTGCTSTRLSPAEMKRYVATGSNTKQEIAVSRNAIPRTEVSPALSSRFAPAASIAFDAAHRAEQNRANR